jgi:N-acyl-D-aspartate/D-glutamate deacylase
MNLDEVASRFGVLPSRAAELLLERDPGVWVIVHAMAESDVQRVMKHDATLFGSDGLPTLGGRPHPRLHGTFPRILGHYCRDLGTLGLEEAISKMTRRAAERFAIAGRGTIEPGAFADLVLFDAKTISAAATYQHPTESPVGICGVWVNGQQVVREGAHTGARPGGALRRQPRVDAAREISAQSIVSP